MKPPKDSKLVIGFTDYCVSTKGIVYTRKVYGSKTGRLGEWYPLKPVMVENRPKVSLYTNVGKYIQRFVHQVVMMTFIGPRPKGLVTRHLDGNPMNNDLKNLTYGTEVENYADAVRHGTAHLGERHYRAKLKERDVLVIRYRHANGDRTKDIAKDYKISSQAITEIVMRRNWKRI